MFNKELVPLATKKSNVDGRENILRYEQMMADTANSERENAKLELENEASQAVLDLEENPRIYYYTTALEMVNQLDEQSEQKQNFLDRIEKTKDLVNENWKQNLQYSLESLEYDNSNNLFTLVHIGYEGTSFNYTLEIPYQILQYSDRIELQAYRVYITKNVQMQEITSNISNNLYYDKSKSLPAITLNDEVLGMESEQIEYIRGLIEEGTLDKNKLESVQYTFKNNNDIYKLDGFKKI